MDKLSYISGATLTRIDYLKEKVDSYKGKRAIQRHNQRRRALEHESLNSSYFIEYPQNAHSTKRHLSKTDKKLLKRLESAWNYSVGNCPDGHISQRDLEVMQAIIVPEGELGIRTIEVDVTLPDSVNPPPVLLVQECLDEMYQFLGTRGSTLHLVEKAAYMHLELAYIHPFDDGNGRTARMTQNVMLYHGGLVPVSIQEHERGLYFSALQTALRGVIREDVLMQRPFFELVGSKVIDGLEKVLQG